MRRQHSRYDLRHPTWVRVLLLGSDKELSLFRVHILEAAGMQVTYPETKHAAVNAILMGGFDVILISYTLSNQSAEELLELAHQNCPKCPVIAISETGWEDNRLKPDITITADQGPKGMLDAIAQAQRRSLRRVK